MADEEDNSASDDDDVDALGTAHANLMEMFEANPFHGYDSSFDTFEANDSALDAAVLT